MIAINDSLVFPEQMSMRWVCRIAKQMLLPPLAAPKLSAKSSIHDGMNGSTLFALWATHEFVTQASLPYRIFDDPGSVRLLLHAGELSNDITVNVHDIFVRYSDQTRTALTAGWLSLKSTRSS